MADWNTFFISGRVIKEPKRYLDKGKTEISLVSILSLSFYRKPSVVTLLCRGKIAETVNKYVRVGDRLIARGEIQNYKEKMYLKVIQLMITELAGKESALVRARERLKREVEDAKTFDKNIESVTEEDLKKLKDKITDMKIDGLEEIEETFKTIDVEDLEKEEKKGRKKK